MKKWMEITREVISFHVYRLEWRLTWVEIKKMIFNPNAISTKNNHDDEKDDNENKQEENPTHILFALNIFLLFILLFSFFLLKRTFHFDIYLSILFYILFDVRNENSRIPSRWIFLIFLKGFNELFLRSRKQE
jgi:hypothetical protein